jgi:hypothetical protein
MSCALHKFVHQHMSAGAAFVEIDVFGPGALKARGPVRFKMDRMTLQGPCQKCRNDDLRLQVHVGCFPANGGGVHAVRVIPGRVTRAADTCGILRTVRLGPQTAFEWTMSYGYNRGARKLLSEARRKRAVTPPSLTQVAAPVPVPHCAPISAPTPMPATLPEHVCAERLEPSRTGLVGAAFGGGGDGDAPVVGSTYCSTGDTTEEEDDDKGSGVVVGMDDATEPEKQRCGGVVTGDTTEEEDEGCDGTTVAAAETEDEEEDGCGDTTVTEEEEEDCGAQEDRCADAWHEMHLALRAELATAGVPSRRSWEWLRSQVHGPMNGGVQEYRARMLDDMLRRAGYSFPGTSGARRPRVPSAARARDEGI